MPTANIEEVMKLYILGEKTCETVLNLEFSLHAFLAFFVSNAGVDRYVHLSGHVFVYGTKLDMLFETAKSVEIVIILAKQLFYPKILEFMQKHYSVATFVHIILPQNQFFLSII